jgi:glycosyltransferase involved in cell wall biosynthesis
MNVLHIESGRNLYGGALQVLFLLRGLAATNGRHALVCPEHSAIAAAATDLGVPVHPIPMGGDLDAAQALRIRRLILAEQPDLVHIHSRRGADLWGLLAARTVRVPVILTRRVDNPEPRWLARLRYGACDRVVTISEGIRAVLASEGVPDHKLCCVHSAVDAEHYRPGSDQAWFERSFDLPPDARPIGMIAQFIERKGHRTLLAAVPRILDAHPDVRFLLFGQGPLRGEIEQRIAQAGLDDQVRLAGFRDDLHRVIPNLELVVHPARMEGLGVSLLQAAACSVPIVAARVGGIPEVVRDGKNGLLVPPADAAALATAVNQLLSAPDRARALGDRGREIVLSEFSIPAMVAGNLAVYGQVLGR